MFPPLFEILSADTTVQGLLGNGPALRVRAFGEAEQDEKLPYAVWRIIYGSPENSLADIPDTDKYGVQVDVYGPEREPQIVRDVATALRNALEPFAIIVEWNGESRDPDTRNYRVSFTVDFVTYR